MQFGNLRKHYFLKVALDGGTRPRATTPAHPHFLPSMGDGQANAFRWRDTSNRAALSVVLCITYNFDLIIYNYYFKFHNCYHKLHNCIIYNIYNFDHRSVTECNRKIVTTLKIFRQCRCYSDWKILDNLCWLVQFYCSEDKFTMLLRFFWSLSTQTHVYMRMKNVYIHVYKRICIHINII